LFDHTEHILFPWLYENALGVRGVDIGHLCQRGHGTVIVYGNAVKQQRVGSPGAKVGEFVLEVPDSLFHLIFGLVSDQFQFFSHIVVFILVETKVGKTFQRVITVPHLLPSATALRLPSRFMSKTISGMPFSLHIANAVWSI